MKKVISMIMVVALFAAFMIPSAFAAGINVYAGSATYNEGEVPETVTLTIGVSGNTGKVGNGKVTLSYDTANLKLVSLDSAYTANAAVGMISIASAFGIEGDFTVATATFEILNKAPGFYPVNVSAQGFRDNEVPVANPLDVAVVGGGVTIVAKETETTPEPSETETTPEPSETETTPEPSETETTPEPSETETTPVVTDPIPGGEDDEPKTGDITPHIMLAVASVIALGAASMFVFKRKAAK